MSLRSHKVQLSLLREGEEILHNCTSHWFRHLKLPVMYLIGVLLPFIAFYLLIAGSFIREEYTADVLWFLYSSYALAATVYFFLRSVNFELGGCVITNQRILRFGHKGLAQMVERDIMPNKIEDVKVVRQGMLSMFFDMADIKIHTANNEIEVLHNVIDSRKIQNIFTEMLSKYGKTVQKESKGGDSGPDSGWIDDALGQSQGEAFDVDEHREEIIEDIGDVFREGKRESEEARKQEND